MFVKIHLRVNQDQPVDETQNLIDLYTCSLYQIRWVYKAILDKLLKMGLSNVKLMHAVTYWFWQQQNYNPLCSRNFQNVKLRLDFVEIWWFHHHSDFTWNQNWWIQMVKKCHFWHFNRFWILILVNLSHFSSPKITKIQSWETLKF